MKTTKSKKQKGFTLIEILVVVGLLSTLIASGIYFVNFSDRAETIGTLELSQWVHRDMPQALITAYTNNGNRFNGMTKTRITSTAYVDNDVPSATSWAVGAVATGDTININVSTTNAAAATELSNKIQTSGYIASVAPSAAVVTIAYDLSP